MIIWENEFVLVINKPFGLVVNRAESVVGETLQDFLEKRDPRSRQLDRSGIVHRLDKDTSGVMIVAKTKSVAEDLQSQFKKRLVKKEYIALVHGKLEPKNGSVVLPLGRSIKDRRKFSVKLGGRVSETGWQVEAYYQRNGEILTLVKLCPKTGRTHQLRVHLKHLGFGIVGDKNYLSRKRAKKDALWCKRQFLHAHRLKIMVMGKEKEFEAKLSPDLTKILCALDLR